MGTHPYISIRCSRIDIRPDKILPEHATNSISRARPCLMNHRQTRSIFTTEFTTKRSHNFLTIGHNPNLALVHIIKI